MRQQGGGVLRQAGRQSGGVMQAFLVSANTENKEGRRENRRPHL